MLSISKIKQKLSNQYIRNVGWLFSGELVARLVRIGLIVFIARILTPNDYGLAAIILTVKEFALVFTLKGGISGKIIQAEEEELDTLANTAYWLNWIFCGFLFVSQCLISFPIAWFYNDSRLILPICLVALGYLALPTYAIQMAIITRQNRMKIPALAATLQMIFFNLLTLVLAVLGFGLWAIILPRVIVTPVIYFIIANKNCDWRPRQRFTLHRWREIFDYGKNVLGSQLLNKARSNLDYLLVGGVLGVDALGLYYFAYTSGIGISLNIIEKMSSAQFPYICAVRVNPTELRKRYFGTLKTLALVIIPFVALQSSLAPFYVPIVFGEKWIPAIPILMLICLSAIPQAFGNSSSMLLQAVGRADIDFKWNAIYTLAFMLVLAIVINNGLITVAASVLISHSIAYFCFSLWAIIYSLKNS